MKRLPKRLFQGIDEEIKEKNIICTKEEAIANDFYDLDVDLII